MKKFFVMILIASFAAFGSIAYAGEGPTKTKNDSTMTKKMPKKKMKKSSSKAKSSKAMKSSKSMKSSKAMKSSKSKKATTKKKPSSTKDTMQTHGKKMKTMKKENKQM